MASLLKILIFSAISSACFASSLNFTKNPNNPKIHKKFYNGTSLKHAARFQPTKNVSTKFQKKHKIHDLHKKIFQKSNTILKQNRTDKN